MERQLSCGSEKVPLEGMTTMIQAAYYTSPIGEILLAAKENALVGLWLAEQKYDLGSLKKSIEEKPDTQILPAAKNWLADIFPERSLRFPS